MAANSTAGSAHRYCHAFLGRRTVQAKRGACAFCDLCRAIYPSAAIGICECTNVLPGVGRKSPRILAGTTRFAARGTTTALLWLAPALAADQTLPGATAESVVAVPNA